MQNDIYLPLKMLHASCAIGTLLLFIWRGRLALRGSKISHRWLRRVPDSVDTLLLGTGIALVFVSGQYPSGINWLSVKLLSVTAYIALGFMLLRFAPNERVKRVTFGAALGVFAYILLLAFTKSVLPFTA